MTLIDAENRGVLELARSRIAISSHNPNFQLMSAAQQIAAQMRPEFSDWGVALGHREMTPCLDAKTDFGDYMQYLCPSA